MPIEVNKLERIDFIRWKSTKVISRNSRLRLNTLVRVLE